MSGGTGGAGAEAVWAPLASTPVGCAMDRLVNAPQVRAFTWQPCDGVANCERMVLLPVLQEADPGGIAFEGTVTEELGQTRVIIVAGSQAERDVFFATSEGWLLDAYRAPTSPNHCLLSAGAAYGANSGVVIASQLDMPPGRLGGLVHSLGAPGDPTPFEVTIPFGYGPEGPQNTPMGSTRFALNCSPDRLLSLADGDGGDIRVIAQSKSWDPTSNILAIDSIDTNGATFLLGETIQVGAGGVTGIIATTDGKSPPSPYIVATDGSFYDVAAYAGSYVAWFRGINRTDINTYAKVELWASAYDPDPTKLAPFKVDDYVSTGMVPLIGANGRVAASVADGGPPYGSTGVWDIATKKRTVYTLPSAYQTSPPYLGLTSAYLWVKGASGPDVAPDMYVRFALQ